MSIYVSNVSVVGSNVFVLASNVYVNNSGTWIEPREIYINNSGTWTLTHKVVWITVSTNNLDLYNFVGSPSSSVRVLAHITSNVVISSNSISYPSLTVSGFPSGSQVKLVNYGVVKGAGGRKAMKVKAPTVIIGAVSPSARAIPIIIPVRIPPNEY